MTHPESGVLDAIAELEAEEAAHPRRPWWTYAGYAGYPLGWFYGSAGVGEPDRRGGGEGQT